MTQPLTEIGRFLKTHGINGEIGASLYDDCLDLDVAALRCIVAEIDGLKVPFFLESVRTKGSGLLLKIEGVDSDTAARDFVNRSIYALSEEVDGQLGADHAPADGDDGFYAADLVGFTITDTCGNLIGTITDIDDNTENVLFIVEPKVPGKLIYIPVADEFITDINPEGRLIAMDLPEGIITLNS